MRFRLPPDWIHPIKVAGLLLGITTLVLIWLVAMYPSSPVIAAPLSPGLTGDAQTASNDECLACHGQSNMVMEFGQEQLLVSVDKDKFDQSVHGRQDVTCTECHTDITGYPHPTQYRNVRSLRGMQLELHDATTQACSSCHTEQSKDALDSVHQRALEAGNTNAAVCADCHNPHYLEPLAERPRSAIPETCARCHSSIYETYTGSVHGSALIGEGNADVPTCTDCHGVHSIQDPTTVAFRNQTPQLCSRCHTNPEIMGKYGLSTNVLSTYVADFHGTTAVLFEQTHPGQPINTAVCTDCHGIHDISRVDDPQTGIGLKENLLLRCQTCHPGATANFPDAWMSHYIPDQQRYPTVYFVDLFYKIMIPTVIGGMLIFVVTDGVRRLIERRKGVAH